MVGELRPSPVLEYRQIVSGTLKAKRQPGPRQVVAPYARTRAIALILSELAGMSARAVAAELNARQVETPSGTPWSAKTVIRARERLTV